MGCLAFQKVTPLDHASTRPPPVTKSLAIVGDGPKENRTEAADFCVSPQISKIIESLNTMMQEKGRELTEYRERYNIRLVGEGEADAQSQSTASSKESEGGGPKSGAGVLVS